MFTSVSTPEEFRQFLKNERAVTVFFSGDSCHVCHALMPKADHILREHFPEMKRIGVNVAEAAELAVQNSVFTVPALIVFFDGREFLRKTGSFSLAELQARIDRPYRLMFS